MELGVDYNFRDDLWNKNEEGSTVPIELLMDPFKGIVYRYTTVSFRMDGDVPKMLYDYEILKTNDLSMITVRKNQKFNTILGLILNMMLLEVDEADANGRDYFKESDTEGTVRQVGPSVSEG